MLLWRHYLFAGCDDSHLYCIDTRSGHLAFKFYAESPVTSTPAILLDPTTPLQEENQLQEEGKGEGRLPTHALLSCCGSDNALFLLKIRVEEDAHEEKEKPRESIHYVVWDKVLVSDNKAKKLFSAPVMLGDKLIVGSRDSHLYCFSLC